MIGYLLVRQDRSSWDNGIIFEDNTVYTNEERKNLLREMYEDYVKKHNSSQTYEEFIKSWGYYWIEVEVDAKKMIEAENDMVSSIARAIIETGTVVTHYGDDLDNKASIYALEQWAGLNGRLDEPLKVLRVPAGQTMKGMLNIDTGGHKGSRIEDDGTIVIDGDPANGVKSAAQALADLGIYIPEQILELADTVPNRVSALDSRSGLALTRYLSGEQIFYLGRDRMLDKSLTDEELEIYGLVEAHKKQQAIIDNAVAKIQKYTVEMPDGQKMVLAPEQILGGSAIAYEMGISYYVSASQHYDQEKQPDGVTFAITSKPGTELPEEILQYGRRLVEEYRTGENTSGVFVNPNGQMVVAGGIKNPEFRIPGETVEGMLGQIRDTFLGRNLESKKNEEQQGE